MSGWSDRRLEDALLGEPGLRHPTLDAIRSLAREREQAIKGRANALERMHEAERALLEATEALEDTGVEPPDGCDPEGPPSSAQVTQWVERACDELQDERDRNARLASDNRRLRQESEKAKGALAACGRWELAAQGIDPGPDADEAQRGLYCAVEACQYDNPRHAGNIIGAASVDAVRLYGSKED